MYCFFQLIEAAYIKSVFSSVYIRWFRLKIIILVFFFTKFSSSAVLYSLPKTWVANSVLWIVCCSACLSHVRNFSLCSILLSVSEQSTTSNVLSALLPLGYEAFGIFCCSLPPFPHKCILLTGPYFTQSTSSLSDFFTISGNSSLASLVKWTWW